MACYCNCPICSGDTNSLEPHFETTDSNFNKELKESRKNFWILFSFILLLLPFISYFFEF